MSKLSIKVKDFIDLLIEMNWIFYWYITADASKMFIMQLGFTFLIPQMNSLFFKFIVSFLSFAEPKRKIK